MGKSPITHPHPNGATSESGWLRSVPTTLIEVDGQATISILLADDHAFVRRSLRALLDSDRALEVVGESSDVQVAMRDVEAHSPHVLVLDVGMPGGSVLAAIRELRARAPETAVVITTMLDDPRFAREAIAAGAHAYVLTDTADRDLPLAVRAAARGESFVSPELEQLLRIYDKGPDGLSCREVEVLRMIGLGYTNTEIGDLLALSVRTVESHRASIHRKLGLTTRAELVRYALRRGLLAPELATDSAAR
ncbi:MAG: response regulator transcription factor [Solirubrobacteraceae bacterium]|jgi:two-component system response regulator NreC